MARTCHAWVVPIGTSAKAILFEALNVACNGFYKQSPQGFIPLFPYYVATFSWGCADKVLGAYKVSCGCPAEAGGVPDHIIQKSHSHYTAWGPPLLPILEAITVKSYAIHYLALLVDHRAYSGQR